MMATWLSRWLKQTPRPDSRPKRRTPEPNRFVPALQRLGERIAPAVAAFFTPNLGVLTVVGDNLDNEISVELTFGGQILVNGGTVPVQGGAPTGANTSLIQVFGLGGNDAISLNAVNAVLPRANVFGGAGDDVIVSGSGADLIFGQAGNDVILGRGGADRLFGGAGDDVLSGGSGDDQVFGEAGNDRMAWVPGSGTDLNEGGAGDDTVEVSGDHTAEFFTVTANGSRVRLDRVKTAPFSLDIGTVENLIVRPSGGADTILLADTTGTGLATINLDLAGTPGGSAGDNQADTVIVNSTNGDDIILLEGDLDDGDGTAVAVFGLSAVVNITASEAANDLLRVNALAGNDAVDASGLSAGAIRFAADGGAGDDVLIGSAGDDVLFGGAGDDVLIGGPGLDDLDGGDGDDLEID